MVQASVGFQCPNCVQAARAAAPRQRTAFGGLLTSRAYVTWTIIAINVAVFLATLPYDTLYYNTFPANLALVGDFQVWGVAQGEYWRLLTSMFLHLDPIHLLLNMIGVFIFGSFLERAFGWWRYLALYLLSGLAGSAAAYWLGDPTGLTLGASGSVYGLFGAALIVVIRQRADVTQLALVLGLNLVLSFSVPRISWQAHIGGLLVGLAVGAVYAYAPRDKRNAIQAAALGVLAVGIAAAIVARTAVLA